MSYTYPNNYEISSETPKTFETTVILLFLDDFKGRLSQNNTLIPVKMWSGRDIVGFATLEVKNKKLLAHISIDYNNEARLSAQTDREFYAHPIGQIKHSPGDGFDYYPENLVFIQPGEVIIEGIEIDLNKPLDNRIEPFGAPILV